MTLARPDSFILKALSHIILDVTYMDSKNKSMIDTLETKEEIFKKFFTNKHILERLRSGKCSLILF
jgi:protein CMS1